MATTKARKTKTSRAGDSKKPRLPKDVAAAVTAVGDKKAEDVVVLDLGRPAGSRTTSSFAPAQMRGR